MGLYFRHLAAQGGREHAALSGDMTTAALDITITAVTVAKTPLVFAGAAGPSSGAFTVTWTGLTGGRCLGATAAPAVQSGAGKETLVTVFWNGSAAAIERAAADSPSRIAKFVCAPRSLFYYRVFVRGPFKFRARLQPPPLKAAAPGFLASSLGVVATAPRGIRRWATPPPFPADRRGGTMPGPRHGTQTLALLGHHHHRRPFFGRPLFVVLGHHNTYKCRGVAFDSRLRPIKTSTLTLAACWTLPMRRRPRPGQLAPCPKRIRPDEPLSPDQPRH